MNPKTPTVYCTRPPNFIYQTDSAAGQALSRSPRIDTLHDPDPLLIAASVHLSIPGCEIFTAKHAQCIACLLCIPTAGIDDSLYRHLDLHIPCAQIASSSSACMNLRAYILMFIVSINIPSKISPPGPITRPDWRAVSQRPCIHPTGPAF